MQVFSLSIHADYRCRNSGACCSADWDVPVELPVYRSLAEAFAHGRLAAGSAEPRAPFVTGPDLPDEAAAMLARTDGGDCVFYHRGSGLCVVHRDLGETALPSTCRHFPRVAVRDWRGTFVTLSHFCPTAASMLFRDDVAVEVVESPTAFPPANYEGLTVAADAWPPMLHPRMLMDLEGFTAWERHMVWRCAAVDRRPESIVATLARDAGVLRGWRPGNGSLAAAVASLPPAVVDAEVLPTLESSLRVFQEALICVPEELKPPADEHGLAAGYAGFVRPRWDRFRAPLNRFLAAKAFASWAAYQGRGVRTMVRGLEAALALVRVEAARQCRNAGRPLDCELLLESFRATDFILNHLAVGEDLAARWSRVERDPFDAVPREGR